MDSNNQERHRPGALKQQNKSHKSGNHRTKGAINKAQKGKTNSAKTLTKKFHKQLRKEDRRHQALQLRRNKRAEVLSQKRSLGGIYNAPFLVAVVPICEDIDPLGAVELLNQADAEALIRKTTQGNVHINVPRFKQRFTFVTPRVGDLNGILDTLKVADSVLFLVSVNDGFDSLGEVGEAIMSAAIAQRLPTPIVTVVDLESVPIKRRTECKQNVQDALSRWLPGEKVASLQTTLEAVAILRRIGGQKRRAIAQRDRRSLVIAEHVELSTEHVDGKGTLRVEGFVRGQPLSANSLIHIPGFGQYQIQLIEVLSDPTIDGCSNVLEKVTPKPDLQESLVSENDVDPMDAEQTWPTAEDHREADLERKTKKVRVPKGMSDYQAAWIPDNLLVDAVDEDEDSESEDADEMEVEQPASESSSEADDEEPMADDASMTCESEVAGDTERYDDKMDLAEEQAARTKAVAARDDVMFPDEVDTPADVPARVRFQKYRGLQSFRTSTWDPTENLPPDYARIFQFQNYERMRKKVKVEDDEAVSPGKYVRVHLAGVEREVFSEWRVACAPMLLCALHPHEQKMSMLNIVVHNNSDAPIASKETLIFHVGFRRFKARPVFSQHSNGNKHKYERFWQPGATVVASMYAPVIFAPATVLVFKENKDGDQDMVGAGHVLSMNPGRIVTKRVVLSGHPFKVLKRSAVVRFMFFNRDDIIWFKPVELTTRYGRRGHIKEPLGTHGHMKCSFDSQLKSQDTVFMRLYKRVFPPWSYENLTGCPPPLC